MAQPEFYYCWDWQLAAAPEALWPYVANTNRFNRDTGLPAVADLTAAAGGNGRRQLRFDHPLLKLTWEEEPFSWSYPHAFGVLRRYKNGPMRQMRVQTTLTPTPGGGTHLTYEVWAAPRNLLGRLGIPLAIGQIAARRFAAAFRRYDTLAQAAALPVTQPVGPAHLAPGAQRRVAQLQARLLAEDAPAALVEKLVDLVLQADDLTLARLRPYALADAWDAPRRQVLELCLLATRVGLLDFRWDLLCPMCRGAGDSPAHLADVSPTVHCPTCHIDYTVNFDQSVELTFVPNAAVRRVEVYDFCVAGPQVTPHVVLQQLLPPGARETAVPTLQPGRYRLRTMALPGSQAIRVAPGGEAAPTLRVADGDWAGGELLLAEQPRLQLHNASGAEQLLILERVAWSDQAATAAEVTALQRFRDLFADEALRPDTQLSVGHMTVLFTDLRDSTRLYRDIGDARAFGLVLGHFDILREAIDRESGAIVKTIGDAVMAVFPRPVLALQAVLRAQQALQAAPPGQPPLTLKAAIHAGPAIAVNLNDRLDYFGTTVNVASRLEKFSLGADVILSKNVYEDPEVTAWVAAAEARLLLEPFEEMIKGFDGTNFMLWRIRPEQIETAVHQPPGDTG
ncbi:MAG: hypothetical protein KC425_20520 [Anaerolineales bacterium]|nr:hypothetical protein [Anaerolineales bacterium]